MVGRNEVSALCSQGKKKESKGDGVQLVPFA